MRFKEWLQETGNDDPIPPTPDQARRPDLIVGGLPDGTKLNNPMRRKSNPTSAFHTYSLPGSDPLPGNKKLAK